MKNIFDTKTITFQELLGNGRKYKIPEFQRDYSWTEENWEDLWQDMIDIYEIKSISGNDLGTIYICPYHQKTSNKAPIGFKLI